MRTLTRLCAVLSTVVMLGISAEAHALAVDVELQLLVDVSGSVDSTEFALQRDGYKNAFKSQPVIDAILDTSNGRHGRIAVQFIYWSGSAQQQIVQDWFLIDSSLKAVQFGNLIGLAPMPFMGLTAPGNALNFGAPLFQDNGYEGDRLVIDVSGDGTENNGADTATARDAALASGVDVINGLVILNEEPATFDFYLNNVVGGSGAFLNSVTNFNDFQAAIQTKLEREIQAPEPGPLLLLGLGFTLLGIARRTRPGRR